MEYNTSFSKAIRTISAATTLAAGLYFSQPARADDTVVENLNQDTVVESVQTETVSEEAKEEATSVQSLDTAISNAFESAEPSTESSTITIQEIASVEAVHETQPVQVSTPLVSETASLEATIAETPVLSETHIISQTEAVNQDFTEPLVHEVSIPVERMSLNQYVREFNSAMLQVNSYVSKVHSNATNYFTMNVSSTVGKDLDAAQKTYAEFKTKHEKHSKIDDLLSKSASTQKARAGALKQAAETSKKLYDQLMPIVPSLMADSEFTTALGVLEAQLSVYSAINAALGNSGAGQEELADKLTTLGENMPDGRLVDSYKRLETVLESLTPFQKTPKKVDTVAFVAETMKFESAKAAKEVAKESSDQASEQYLRVFKNLTESINNYSAEVHRALSTSSTLGVVDAVNQDLVDMKNLYGEFRARHESHKVIEKMLKDSEKSNKARSGKMKEAFKTSNTLYVQLEPVVKGLAADGEYPLAFAILESKFKVYSAMREAIGIESNTVNESVETGILNGFNSLRSNVPAGRLYEVNSRLSKASEALVPYAREAKKR